MISPSQKEIFYLQTLLRWNFQLALKLSFECFGFSLSKEGTDISWNGGLAYLQFEPDSLTAW